MGLRIYQKEAFDNTIEVFKTASSALCVMATGLGKTYYGAHVVKHYAKTGRIMWLAHREELINQAQKAIGEITGEVPDKEMGEDWANHGWLKTNTVVSSIQTQIAGREGGRMTQFKPEDFSLVVVDEGHHAISDSYGKVLDWYGQNKDLKILALTATPDRHDGKAMGKRFEVVAYKYDIKDGIDDGWLVPIEQQSVFVKGLDYSEIKTQMGDLNGKELAKVLEFEENLHAIAGPTVELTKDKKTLIFAASVVQGERLTEIINRHKPDSARFVCGTTPKETRRTMFADYAEKRFQYLVNVGVATEGFDDPGIQCVVLARPTKSRSLFTQMVGRGTRPLPGIVDLYDDSIKRCEAIERSQKPAVEVIDFVGNAGRHKLMTTADILGGDYTQEVIDLAAKNASEKSAKEGKPADVATELQQAEHEMARNKRAREEAEIRDGLLFKPKYFTKKFNLFNVLDITPVQVQSWNKEKPPTQGQLDFLKRKGVNVGDMGYTHARQAVKELKERQKQGRCTLKQARCLRKAGIDSSSITFEYAGKLMGELVSEVGKRKWAVPHSWKSLDCYIGKM
jgi:superfamily II DNA or RNA helicase